MFREYCRIRGNRQIAVFIFYHAFVDINKFDRAPRIEGKPDIEKSAYREGVRNERNRAKSILQFKISVREIFIFELRKRYQDGKIRGIM